MNYFTDTHCHLYFNNFDKDRDEVLTRAWKAGLNRILIPGIDIISSQNTIKISEAHHKLFTAVGVHPNSATTWEEDTIDYLFDLSQRKKVVAIGEIGLDYYRDYSPREVQLRVFRSQLKLAEQVELPVVIHNRESTKDVLKILLDWQADLSKSGSPLSERPGVLHSFSGDEESAKKAISSNFMIGITGPVTFKNATQMQRIVTKLPIDSILIETDSPFLTPHPKRGQRNEPSNVILVAEKIAELQERPLSEVARLTSENAEKLFKW